MILTVTRNEMQLIELICKDTQVASKEKYPTLISDDVALTPDALLKVKCSCSEEIQCRLFNLDVQCFVHVREVTGVSVIKKGRLSRPMMTMITTRCDSLLFIFVMTGTIKVYFNIYECILSIFLDVTNTMQYCHCRD